MISKFAFKMILWRRLILNMLKVSKAKLLQYYGRTYQEKGDIYSATTILSSEYKLTAFEILTWEVHWKDNYQQQFTQLFYNQYADNTALGTDSNSKWIYTQQVDSLSQVL
jgi:hypothetical protein